LDRSNAYDNLQNAFEVAETEFGIERLLDPEDFDVEHPDEKSVITYIVSYYIYLTKLKHENVQVFTNKEFNNLFY
jgi:spectrin beta